MSIDRFSLEDFSKALPAKATHLGMEKGEHVFAVQLTQYCRLYVRSSIGESGIAGDTGEDSIRIIYQLYQGESWRSVGKGDGKWITRVPGWQRRLEEALVGMSESPAQWVPELCGKCGKGGVFVALSKSEKNPNRPFAKHDACGWFTWLDGEKPEQQQEIEEVDPFATIFTKKEVMPAFKKKEGPEPNEQQWKIIDAPIDGPKRVQAGPGAGKTFTIVRMYLNYVDEGVHPDRIALLTFSKDMADSMLAKVLEAMPEVGQMEARNKISTFHALGYRMLNKYDSRKWFKPPDWKVGKLLDDIAKTLWEQTERRPSANEILSVISACKAHGLRPHEDTDFILSLAGIEEEDAHKVDIARETFDRAMEANGWLTFPDMPYRLWMGLKYDPVFKLGVQSEFDYLIVDEAQDTASYNMEIVHLLAENHRNVVLVGDIDQMLYRFAYATPEENLGPGFERRYPEGTMFFLETNYRSTRQIVRLSNEAIASNYKLYGGPYDNELMKDLAPRENAPEGEPAEFRHFPGPEDEAQFVAEVIEEDLKRSGAMPDDYYVLSRTRAQLAYVEAKLISMKIPYVNLTGGGFWLTKQAKDMVAYVKVLAGCDTSEDFKRIANIASNDFWLDWQNDDDYGQYVPTRRLGKKFLEAFPTYPDVPSEVWGNWGHGVRDLHELISNVYWLTNDGSHWSIWIRAIIDRAYNKYIKYTLGGDGDGEGEGVADIAETVYDLAKAFETVDEFIKYVEDAQEAAEAAKDKKTDGRVVLSTIHRVKGQEREVVFVLGCSEGEVVVADQFKPYGLLPHTFSLTAPPPSGVLGLLSSTNSIEDERCIFFVAVSRAKSKVYLTSIGKYRSAVLQPSRFINEVAGSLSMF